MRFICLPNWQSVWGLNLVGIRQFLAVILAAIGNVVSSSPWIVSVPYLLSYMALSGECLACYIHGHTSLDYVDLRNFFLFYTLLFSMLQFPMNQCSWQIIACLLDNTRCTTITIMPFAKFSQFFSATSRIERQLSSRREKVLKRFLVVGSIVILTSDCSFQWIYFMNCKHFDHIISR